MYLKKSIFKYKVKKAYYKKTTRKKQGKRGYYVESMNALIEYMKRNEKNPNEKQWNKYAIKNKYLSSKTIGYLSEIGFNKLCRNLRKQINNERRIV
mgnify:CR=1 FL=1